MTVNFSVVDDPAVCVINFGVVLGAVAAQAADKYRVSPEFEPVAKVFAEFRRHFSPTSAEQAQLTQGDRVALSQLTDALSHEQRLLSPITLGYVLGRSPPDVVRLLSPVGYALSLGSPDVVGPEILTGRPVATGARYVALPGGRGVLLLAPGEESAAWTEALAERPLSDAIATICREWVVEILSPSAAGLHPLVRHIEKCIGAR